MALPFQYYTEPFEAQDILRDPRRRRACGGGSRRVHAISGDWRGWINELSKTRKVIAVETKNCTRLLQQAIT